MKVGGVSAVWDKPKGKISAVLVLAHGAAGDLNDSVLRGVGSAMSKHGVATLRFNFPYREAGRRAPGSQSQSEDYYRAINARAHDEVCLSSAEASPTEDGWQHTSRRRGPR